MNSLPIPKLRASWISAVFLTMVLFFAYYTSLYGLVLQEYTSQFRDITFLSATSEDARLRGLKITANIPRYIYGVEPIWIFVTVQNTGNQTFLDTKIDLNISLTSPMLLLPSTYSEDKYIPYKTNIEIKEIGPGSIIFGRIPLIVQSGIDIKSIWLHTNIKGERENPVSPVQSERSPQSKPIPTENSLRALQHSFIQNILLPPWSNGLIFALAMFSSYLAHDKRSGKNDEEEPDIFTAEMFKSVIINLWKSTIILGLLIIPIVGAVFGRRGLALLGGIFLMLVLIILTFRLANGHVPLFARSIKNMKNWVLSHITDKYNTAGGTWTSPKIVNSSLIIMGIVLLLLVCFAIFFLDSWERIGLIVFSSQAKFGVIILLSILGFALVVFGIFYKPQEKNMSKSKPSGSSKDYKQDETRDSNSSRNIGTNVLDLRKDNRNPSPSILRIGEKMSGDPGNPLPDALNNKNSEPKENLKKFDNEPQQEKVDPPAALEKKKSIQFSLFKNHEVDAEKIDKFVDKAYGTSREAQILTDCEDDLNSKYYNDRTGVLGLIFKKRNIPPLEIRVLMAKIKERTLEVEKEKLAREKEIEEQNKMIERRKNRSNNRSQTKKDKDNVAQSPVVQGPTDTSSSSQDVSAPPPSTADEDIEPDNLASKDDFTQPENPK